MARKNSIWAGPFNEYQPQTVEGFVSAASLPGTIVRRGASNALTVGAAPLGAETKYYILNEQYINGTGRDLDTQVATNTTAEAFEIQERINYTALLADGQNITALDTPLTVNTDGTLQAATVGTHHIVAYANEVFNNNTGSAQLINIRKA